MIPQPADQAVMREYNEELLGASESTGDTGTEVDYGRPRTVCSTRRWTTVRCECGASAWHWNHGTSPCPWTAEIPRFPTESSQEILSLRPAGKSLLLRSDQMTSGFD